MDLWLAVVELFSLCIVIFLASFLSGLVPLRLSVQDKTLEVLNIFGCGLLLGTGLAVVVPEGVSALYSVDHDSHVMNDVEMKGMSSEILLGISLLGGFMFLLTVEWITANTKVHHHGQSGAQMLLRHSHHPSFGSDENEMDLERQVVHQRTSEIIKQSQDPISPEEVKCVTDGRDSFTSAYAHSVDGKPILPKMKKSMKTLTLGLLIHAAADGLALGAVKASQYLSADKNAKDSTQMVIFTALIFHKIPASLGLSLFLKAQQIEAEKIRRTILYFSSAAPIAALAVFLLLGFMETLEIDQEAIQSGAELKIAACLLLFSGGTFIYVAAVHLLGELDLHKMSFADYIMLVVGCVIPLIFMSLHEE